VSQESATPDAVELAQRLLDASNARDTDAAISLFAPDAVYAIRPTSQVFEGRAAIRGFFEDFLDAYDELEVDIEEICDLGSGVSFSVVAHRGRPRSSVKWAQARFATVAVVADGLIERTTNYADIDEARAAAERLADERGQAVVSMEANDPMELFRQGFEAMNRRDFDALMTVFSPDTVWDFTDWGIGTFDGPTSVRGFYEDWQGSYDVYHVELEEFVDLGHGVIFVTYSERARPTGSPAEVEWQRGYVAQMRDGLIEHVTFYTDADEARAAAERLGEERG
jgi:steroid delta-isomerase-like uncharacterized protein